MLLMMSLFCCRLRKCSIRVSRVLSLWGQGEVDRYQATRHSKDTEVTSQSHGIQPNGILVNKWGELLVVLAGRHVVVVICFSQVLPFWQGAELKIEQTGHSESNGNDAGVTWSPVENIGYSILVNK